jgi:hypothetical protein
VEKRKITTGKEVGLPHKIIPFSTEYLPENGKTTKVGVRGKRSKAGWENPYLVKLLKNQMRLLWRRDREVCN